MLLRLAHRPFCFHHGTFCAALGRGAGDVEGAVEDPVGTFGTEGGSGETLMRLRYLIQYNPVPGMPIETYRCPLAETPYLNPGTPQLQPMPRLENVHRNGPCPNTLRNRHID